MRYVSTRGSAPELGFADTLLTGLATDGGLYVPAEWPRLPALDPEAGYAANAAAVMAPYVGDDVPPAVLADVCAAAYATFRHPAVCPLVQIGDDEWLLELFHGPRWPSRTWRSRWWAGCSTTCWERGASG